MTNWKCRKCGSTDTANAWYDWCEDCAGNPTLVAETLYEDREKLREKVAKIEEENRLLKGRTGIDTNEDYFPCETPDMCTLLRDYKEVEARAADLESAIRDALQQLEELPCDAAPDNGYTLEELEQLERGEIDAVSHTGQRIWLTLHEALTKEGDDD